MTSTHDLESRQPDTIVITSVDTLKTAFLQWTEEQERQRRAAEKEAMLDEETVLHRLGKSWPRSGDGTSPAISPVTRSAARTATNFLT